MRSIIFIINILLIGIIFVTEIDSRKVCKEIQCVYTTKQNICSCCQLCEKQPTPSTLKPSNSAYTPISPKVLEALQLNRKPTTRRWSVLGLILPVMLEAGKYAWDYFKGKN